jgi:hypothetical protein
MEFGWQHCISRGESVRGEKRSTLYFKGEADNFLALKFPRQIPLVFVLNVFWREGNE